MTSNVKFDAAVKSDRLIAVLLALQQTGKEAAPALAERLEVSVRTIYRDIDALSAAGVPVYAERGSQGGIVLADSYRDALARFDDDELRGLFVTSDDALHEIGLRGGRRSALDKLARAVPHRARETLGQLRGRVHVDAQRWTAGASPPAPLAALREAVFNDRCVMVAYSDRGGAVTRRTLEPYGLVSKAGVWYLVAGHDAKVKTFRVGRIARVRVLAQRFTRPAHFDLAEHWRRAAVGASTVAPDEPPCVVTFRMGRNALSNAALFCTVESRRRIRGSVPPAWTVRVVFPSFTMAVREASGWGDAAIAIDPPDVRRAIAGNARALLALYEDEPKTSSRAENAFSMKP